MLQRTLKSITQVPYHQGFLGIGHDARAVLGNVPFTDSDPFILFMDDKLNLPGGKAVGGAHPHAGFETLTLVIKGNNEWKTGSFELMTAGKGIEHTEEITAEQNIQILQVWLALPPEKRWAQPFWQKIELEKVPTIQHEKHEIRVYSGTSNGLISPLKNQTPLTLVDFSMKADHTISQKIPANFNGLIYVLDGSVQIGDKKVESGQTGWVDRPSGSEESEIVFSTTLEGTRFIFYAAQAHNAPIVSHGPFIGDSMEDISRLYREYRNGEIPHLNNLSQEQKVTY